MVSQAQVMIVLKPWLGGPLLEALTPTVREIAGRLNGFSVRGSLDSLAGELDSLLSDCAGDKGALNTLEKLQQAEQKAKEDLAGMLDRLRKAKERNELNETLEKAAIAAANQAESKQRQAEAVSKLVDANNRTESCKP